MTSKENDSQTGSDSSAGLSRRRVLQVAGGAAAGAVAFSGTAAASKSQFFGCTQVCTGTDQSYAVVRTESGVECRLLDKQNPSQYSERGNITWGNSFACHEVGEDEAVIGVLYRTSPGSNTCGLCLNPNRCAQNYYSSKSALVTELNESDCACNVVETCEGEVYGSSYGRGGGPPNGNDNGR